MFQNQFAYISDIVSKRPFLIATLCAGLSALMAFGFLKGRETEILKVAVPVQVIVATQNIQPGETIDEEAIKKIIIPAKFVEPDSFSEREKVAGRVAAVFIKKGAQLTASIAKRQREFRSVAAIIPSGYRAVSVPVEDALSLIIRPNDAVDILATFDLGNNAASRRTTMTIVENVQVLSVGKNIADSLPDPPAKKDSGIFSNSASYSLKQNEPSLTLAVTPKQAQVITFAKKMGIVSVSVRPKGDEDEESRVEPTTISTIAGEYEDLLPIKNNFREYKGK